jgi:hypothetical protein
MNFRIDMHIIWMTIFTKKNHRMLYFKKGQVPSGEFSYAVKKPIPVKFIQMHEPFQVETMEGMLEGKAGDYLMIGVKGEMYPIAKDVFQETYEVLKPDDHGIDEMR